MTTHDPNVHWDGRQWLRWNGVAWQPANLPAPAYTPAPPVPQVAAGGYLMQPPGRGYVTDQGGKNVQAIFAWIFTVLTLGYMLPWAIAATRGKANAGMIGILNFFVGWTLIGWIAALVMACSAHQIAATPHLNVLTAVNYPPAYPGPVPYPPQQPAPYPQPPYPAPGYPPPAAPAVIEGTTAE